MLVQVYTIYTVFRVAIIPKNGYSSLVWLRKNYVIRQPVHAGSVEGPRVKQAFVADSIARTETLSSRRDNFTTARPLGQKWITSKHSSTPSSVRNIQKVVGRQKRSLLSKSWERKAPLFLKNSLLPWLKQIFLLQVWSETDTTWLTREKTINMINRHAENNDITLPKLPFSVMTGLSSLWRWKLREATSVYVLSHNMGSKWNIKQS